MFDPYENSQPFSVYAVITKAVREANGDYTVRGPLSNPSADLQNEEMDVPGLLKGLEVFDQLDRPVDWDHLWEKTRDPDYLIGKGIERYVAPHPKTGIDVPWLKSSLWGNKEFTQKAVRHLESGGSLGYSVAGRVLLRDPSNPNRITRPMVTSVAITPVPVVSENTGCLELVKSLRQADRARTPQQIRAVRFPVVPDLNAILPWEALGKAMEATPGLPHTGPGINAAGVEDLIGGLKRIRRRRRHRRLRKSELNPAQERVERLSIVLRNLLADLRG